MFYLKLNELLEFDSFTFIYIKNIYYYFNLLYLTIRTIISRLIKARFYFDF
jgi:hypothetical protein